MKKAAAADKKSTSAATNISTAGPLKKIPGGWQRSSVTERTLTTLRRDGFLPA